MGMFSRTGYLAESAIDIDSIPAQECYEENSMDSALRVMAENTANWNAIMESIGIEELSVYESTGSDIIYEEGTITNIFNKFKEVLKKIIEKIKGIFNKFMTVLNSWTAKDKEFTRKYKSDLLKANTKDFEFKGFKFTLDKIDTGSFSDNLRDTTKSKFLSSTDKNGKTYGLTDIKSDTDATNANKYEEVKKNFIDQREDILDEYRGQFINDGSKIDASDFSKELFEALRNGESTPDTLDDKDIEVYKCIQDIENTEKDKKNAKKLFDAINKGISDAIKEIDDINKELIRNTPDKSNSSADANKLNTAKIGLLSAIISIYESEKSINTVVYGAYIQAIKDRNRQSKQICVKLLTRKQPKNESASYYEDGSSMLGNAKLI